MPLTAAPSPAIARRSFIAPCTCPRWPTPRAPASRPNPQRAINVASRSLENNQKTACSESGRCGGAPEAPARASTMAKKNRRERALARSDAQCANRVRSHLIDVDISQAQLLERASRAGAAKAPGELKIAARASTTPSPTPTETPNPARAMGKRSLAKDREKKRLRRARAERLGQGLAKRLSKRLAEGLVKGLID